MANEQILKERRRSPIEALGNFFAKVTNKFLPDAFIFAVILLFVVFVAGMIFEKQSFVQMTSHMGNGFWKFLAFSMQMVLVCVTGSALATSKPFHTALKALAQLAKTPNQAIVLITLVATVGCWLNWGFGLILAGLLAKELAKNVKGVHYPLLVAGGYTGLLVWHSGFSGSIPLKIAGGADAIMTTYADGAIVPISQTILGIENLALNAVLLITLPLLLMLMNPKNKKDVVVVDPKLFDEVEVPKVSKADWTPAQKLENSWIVSMLMGALGVSYIIYHFATGGAVGLNIVNFIFLFLGILFHGTPIKYVRAVSEAVKGASGIILQFPFYAGIMGMMIHSGLAESISIGFVNISTDVTFPLFTFLSAGIVNFFVPSGGGQWGVQGAFIMPAAKALNVPYSSAAMALAWGDAWTNMVQPFWALPLLGIAKLKIRDIMGYTTVVLLYSGVVCALFMLFVY